MVELIHRRCAGIDIGKKSAKVCVRVQGAGSRGNGYQVTDWGSMTREILGLREYLIEQQVSCVMMEATSDYWKPFYYVLEDAGFEVMLVNAKHVKNLPGRKSDVSDAVWLAEVCAHGLARASFIPPPEIRELRDLTRTRTIIARERVREITRLEKRLESPGIKLSVVASSLAGVSAQRMLNALIDGERDPEILADLAVPQMRGKHDQLVEALTGRFSDHDAFLVRLHLRRIAELDQGIAELDARIEVVIEPFRHLRERLSTIPGVSSVVADIIIAETGGDMTAFPSPGHLAAWAGVAPGQYESAGRRKNIAARKGNTYLKGGLGIAALSVTRTKNTYLAARYRRIASRRGHLRAVVATERSILTAVWHILAHDVDYHELGIDHYQQAHPTQVKRRALRQLRALGYDVELRPAS
jgi:transposase